MAANLLPGPCILIKPSDNLMVSYISACPMSLLQGTSCTISAADSDVERSISKITTYFPSALYAMAMSLEEIVRIILGTPLLAFC